jgi:hypothetical protein
VLLLVRRLRLRINAEELTISPGIIERTCGLLNILGVEVSLWNYMSVFFCNATPKQTRAEHHRLSDCARVTAHSEVVQREDPNSFRRIPR